MFKSKSYYSLRVREDYILSAFVLIINEYENEKKDFQRQIINLFV